MAPDRPRPARVGVVAGLVITGVITLLGVALFDLAATETEVSAGDRVSNQLVYCAEGALARTMVDSAGRMGQISNALLLPGATLSWSETTTTNSIRCATTITFTDDSTNKRRMLQATSSAPNGVQRSVRIQLNFLPLDFQYAMVADFGDLYLGGAGSTPSSGPGGSDIVNGDIFINGKAYIGSPSVLCSGGSCVNTTACGQGTCSSSPQVNPRTTLDSTPTVSVPTSSSWTQALSDHSSAWPTSSDSKPFGKQADLPQPDVSGYVSALKGAVGITGSNPGNLTGFYQGSPVYNLSAIFAALGRSSSDGSLVKPSGCSCGGGTAGNCAVYCQLVPLGVKMNAPGTRSSMTDRTPEDDFFIDGVYKGSEQVSGKSGVYGAQAVMDFTQVSSQPPVLLASGNVWFTHTQSYGWVVDGRAMVVATNDVIMGDNLIYKNGLGPAGGCASGSTDAACQPATADMLGIIAQRDIWIRRPAVRDVPRGLGDHARRAGLQLCVLRRGRRPDDAGRPVRPERHDAVQPADRRLPRLRRPERHQLEEQLRRQHHVVLAHRLRPEQHHLRGGRRVLALRLAKLNDRCGELRHHPERVQGVQRELVSRPSGTRRISHYQMTVNYDARLFANPMLQAPALSVQTLTGLPGANFGKSWRNWQECPPCS